MREKAKTYEVSTGLTTARLTPEEFRALRAARRRARSALLRAPKPAVPSTLRDRFGKRPSRAAESARRAR